MDSSARSVDRFSRIREALRCCELTRRARTFERMAAGSAYNDQGLVFSDELGDLVSPDWFTRATKRFATEAGVPALTPHAAARHLGDPCPIEWCASQDGAGAARP